ncbi:MAG: hypothetical protein RR229_06590 [Oscillospiraceae bacterium]
MICPKCENEFQSNFLFCPYCGIKLIKEIDKQNSDIEKITENPQIFVPDASFKRTHEEEIEFDYENEFLDEKGKTKKMIAIMFMVFAVICAAISAVCFYIGYNRAEKDNTSITYNTTTAPSTEISTTAETTTEIAAEQ